MNKIKFKNELVLFHSVFCFLCKYFLTNILTSILEFFFAPFFLVFFEFHFYYFISGVYRDEKDKFKCLYLLVETAVAVRQREKEQDDDIQVLGN